MEDGKLKRFWISWNQLTGDYRPLMQPPQPENIRAWWCQGRDRLGRRFVICAIVDAENSAEAEKFCRAAWDSNGKEFGDIRFNTEKVEGWRPNARFPITKTWEKRRLGMIK